MGGSQTRTPRREPPTPFPLPSWGRGALAIALFALSTPAAADVISKAPDAVAVTVYRDRPITAAQLRSESPYNTSGLALVTETRTVDLPAGRTRIAFQGVADAIIPASATLSGLPGGQVERDFDYDLLDPASLAKRTVGQQVTVRRTNPKTGKSTEEPATLASGPDGLVVKTAGGVEALKCGEGPDALIFDHLPEGLADRPTLSVVADAPRAGRYTLTLNYLAVKVDWSADYVARLDPDGQTLDLTGWLTLSNRSGASFADAPTAVVAGKLARVAPDLPEVERRVITNECWPMGRTSDWRRGQVTEVDELAVESRALPVNAPAPPPRMMAAGMLAKPRVVATTLGDYKLYTLAEPTTVAAHETKQVRFLHQPRVKFETLYVYATDDDAPDTADAPTAASVVLSFDNKAENGLGDPIPAGMVSIRQPQALAGGRELFVGEHGVRDVPVGEHFELEVGKASDVQVARQLVADKAARAHRTRYRLAYTLTNAKPAPVTFEVRLTPSREAFHIVSETAPHTLKNGADTWRITLPANGTAGLEYAYEVAE
jgi:hypothetical protein